MGFGGKGANQAVMAARLGAQVSVVTKVGRDIFGQDTLQNYAAQGIDTRYVLFDDTRFSGVAPITVDDHTGQNSIIIVNGANDGLSPEDVRAATDAIQTAGILLCQLEIPLETTLEAFKIAKASGVTTILNPAPARSLPSELLCLTDIIIPNETETALLTGLPVATLEQAAIAAAALHRLGPPTVILTLGARGALFVEGDREAVFVPAQPVQAVDSTGAGDAFVGSLAYFLGKGSSLHHAVERACAIATRTVLKVGTQTSFPFAAEILDLLHEDTSLPN
jgi:ribokinase